MWTPNLEQIITAAQKEAEALSAQRLAEFPNLEPDQFWFVVKASGHEQDLLDWIEYINTPFIESPDNPEEQIENPDYDPVAWAAASSKLQYAKFFERDHPLVEAAREALGMTEQELDALWKYAAS